MWSLTSRRMRGRVRILSGLALAASLSLLAGCGAAGPVDPQRECGYGNGEATAEKAVASFLDEIRNDNPDSVCSMALSNHTGTIRYQDVADSIQTVRKRFDEESGGSWRYTIRAEQVIGENYDATVEYQGRKVWTFRVIDKGWEDTAKDPGPFLQKKDVSRFFVVWPPEDCFEGDDMSGCWVTGYW